MAGICYSIRENRIRNGYLKGFLPKGDGKLILDETSSRHFFYLRGLDSTDLDGTWGRLSFDVKVPETMAFYVYAAAVNEDSTRMDAFFCNPDVTDEEKKAYLQEFSASRFVNCKDMLLYDLKGRYLYLVFEFVGVGEGCISNIKIERQGDNFMQTFPEIYREWGGFFHRYLSIFSSIYHDFSDQIAKLPMLLDLERCPASILPVYAKWLGLDIDCDFWDEKILRTLVKEAYALNRMKGTKQALCRAAGILLGEDVFVQEDGLDVTMLIRRRISETEKSRLMYVLMQFLPIRARLKLVELEQDSMLDAYVYLDVNARIFTWENGILDNNQTLNGTVVVQ